ncbi:MAG: hypothetical protein Q9167_004924 [Letrouitia subvulpina]
MCKQVDEYLDGAEKDDEKLLKTLVISTGVIGQRLPIKKILSKIPEACSNAGSTHDHWLSGTHAICTTDIFPILKSRTFTLPSSPEITYTLAGMAKGSGMIHPNMATLLGIVCTDAAISPEALHQLLVSSNDVSFNYISVDGDMLTNDTLALLANGEAGGQEILCKPDSPLTSQSPDYSTFQTILTDFLIDLAKLIVPDGEGATKFVTIHITGSPTRLAGKHIASAIARSPLVKTALYGKDANWCRILTAMGCSLVDSPYSERQGEKRIIIPEMTSVSFVPMDGSQEL